MNVDIDLNVKVFPSSYCIQIQNQKKRNISSERDYGVTGWSEERRGEVSSHTKI